jgi:hypothetical protein
MVIGKKQVPGGRWLATLGLLAACAADERPLTQLILVADTDVANVDTIQFEVSGPGGTDKELAQATHSATTGPAFVSIVRDDGVLGPLTVIARGLRGTNVLIERTQRVSFVAKQTRVVSLHLFASCLRAPRCAAEQACDNTGCIGQDLSEAQLSSWTGTPPTLTGASGGSDAGVNDAGVNDAGVNDAGVNDAGVNDAGGAVLRECGPAGTVDIQSNNDHCGKCENKCSGGGKTCIAGACVKP